MRPRPSFLLAIFVLASQRVQSFSGVGDATVWRRRRSADCCPRRGGHPQRSATPLRAGFGGGGDSKIDWNPEKNPKIAQLPSYSDNWLLNFHNRDQSQKQLVTNSLAAWNEDVRNEQATIIEWQDSFQRNDLADFTPPMSNGLNCLMVGDDFGVSADDNEDGTTTRRVKLPWEEVSEAQITSLRVLEESMVHAADGGGVAPRTEEITDAGFPESVGIGEDEDVVITVNDENIGDEERISNSAITKSTCGTNGGLVRTEVVGSSITASNGSSASQSAQTPTSTAIRAVDPHKQAAAYDCIVDQGLMDRILSLENSHKTIRELLEEAAIAIKEYGIYVLVTKDLSEDSRTMLEDYGLEAGLEWQFELDGISNDTKVVSVARRFCTGEMPKVGRLSRYQP